MNPMKHAALIGGVLVMLGGVASTARAQHDHAAHAQVSAPMPPPAQPWMPDATLRENMAQIHTALEQLRHYQLGHMDAVLAGDRVELIEHSAAEIFAKCKLPPERDAVLHGMLVPLLAAASRFKASPGDVQQIEAMRTAVAAYPRYFAADGWPVVEHPAH